MYEVKKADYGNRSWPSFGSRYSTVAYAIFQDQCVFSGVTKVGTCTMSAAGQIISAVSRQEGMRPRELGFYCLRTHFTYPQFEPGFFEVNRLGFREVDEEVVVNSWAQVDCPEPVFDIFHNLIGDPEHAFRTYTRQELEAIFWMVDNGVCEIFAPECARDAGFRISEAAADMPDKLLSSMVGGKGMLKIIVDHGDEGLLLRQAGGFRFGLWIK